jgi:hypothetical protein
MMSNSKRRLVRDPYSGRHAEPNIKSALEDALSVLGPENQEAVLYLMQKRYHIDLEKAGSKDEAFSALDDIFGVASDIIKKKVNAHLRLVSMSSQAFGP